MKPSIGRIVHYTLRPEDVHSGFDEANDVRPAIVTNVVEDTTVDLKVFGRGCDVWVHSAPFSEFGAEAGLWHWPARA